MNIKYKKVNALSMYVIRNYWLLLR